MGERHNESCLKFGGTSVQIDEVVVIRIALVIECDELCDALWERWISKVRWPLIIFLKRKMKSSVGCSNARHQCGIVVTVYKAEESNVCWKLKVCDDLNVSILKVISL
jgi:hypothetical protein